MAKVQAGRSKIGLLLVVLIIVVLASTGINVYYLTQDRTAEPTAEAKPTPAPAPELIFVTIDPFTVNLQDGDYDSRLLYTGLSLKVGNAQTRKAIERNMPLIRNRLLLLLSEQNPREVTAVGGKQRLAEKILEQLKRPLDPTQPELIIHDVLFTEFIVQ